MTVNLRSGPPRASAAPRLQIVVATERRYLQQRQPAGLVAALARTGHPPRRIDPDAADRAALHGADVLVARGRSAALLDLLGRAEAGGVATLNPRAAVAGVVDKAAMARAFEAEGIPSPPTRVGPLAELARASAQADFPLVVKPVFGDNARGVRVVWSRDDLWRVPWTEPAALAQPFVPSSGLDLKLYVAGATVWAVRKPSPLSAAPLGAAQPVPCTPELRALALRCGRLFGLELFGVDCIETPRGPVVIEVNDFPNYSGVADADARLARLVVERALSARLAARRERGA